jgi:VIT1/CCC1 family predicted Fe2+/Mn2+ transporter
MTTRLASAPADRRDLFEHTSVREVLMGAQDNLTNVLAVMLGVSIGSGRADLVALAGASAAVAEGVSMGGVLYASTRAEDALRARDGGARVDGQGSALGPVASGFVTFVAALVGGLLPLAPFLVLGLPAAVFASIVVSLVTLFGLGLGIGRISGGAPWREGIRLIAVASLAAMAAAVVGSTLAVD